MARPAFAKHGVTRRCCLLHDRALAQRPNGLDQPGRRACGRRSDPRCRTGRVRTPQGAVHDADPAGRPAQDQRDGGPAEKSLPRFPAAMIGGAALSRAPLSQSFARNQVIFMAADRERYGAAPERSLLRVPKYPRRTCDRASSVNGSSRVRRGLLVRITERGAARRPDPGQ